MKLTKLALIISSGLLGSSMAYAAGNAVLNVEGEIQINGTTVINKAGVFVGASNLAELSDNVVQLSAYEQQPGIYIYEKKGNDYSGVTVRTITENSWKEVTTDTSSYQKDPEANPYYNPNWDWNGNGTEEERSECVAVSCDKAYTKPVEVVTKSINESKSTIAGDIITSTWSFSKIENDVEVNSGADRKVETFKNLSSASENYVIGTLTAEVSRYKIVSNGNDYDTVGTEFVSGNQISYSAKIPTFTAANSKTYQDCLFDGNDTYASEQLIVCPGVGEVQSESLGKLVSYQASPSSRSIGNSSAANQALKIRQDGGFAR